MRRNTAALRDAPPSATPGCLPPAPPSVSCSRSVLDKKLFWLTTGGGLPAVVSTLTLARSLAFNAARRFDRNRPRRILAQHYPGGLYTLFFGFARMRERDAWWASWRSCPATVFFGAADGPSSSPVPLSVSLCLDVSEDPVTALAPVSFRLDLVSPSLRPKDIAAAICAVGFDARNEPPLTIVPGSNNPANILVLSSNRDLVAAVRRARFLRHRSHIMPVSASGVPEHFKSAALSLLVGPLPRKIASSSAVISDEDVDTLVRNLGPETRGWLRPFATGVFSNYIRVWSTHPAPILARTQGYVRFAPDHYVFVSPWVARADSCAECGCKNAADALHRCGSPKTTVAPPSRIPTAAAAAAAASSTNARGASTLISLPCLASQPQSGELSLPSSMSSPSSTSSSSFSRSQSSLTSQSPSLSMSPTLSPSPSPSQTDSHSGYLDSTLLSTALSSPMLSLSSSPTLTQVAPCRNYTFNASDLLFSTSDPDGGTAMLHDFDAEKTVATAPASYFACAPARTTTKPLEIPLLCSSQHIFNTASLSDDLHQILEQKPSALLPLPSLQSAFTCANLPSQLDAPTTCTKILNEKEFVETSTFEQNASPTCLFNDSFLCREQQQATVLLANSLAALVEKISTLSLPQNSAATKSFQSLEETLVATFDSKLQQHLSLIDCKIQQHLAAVEDKLQQHILAVENIFNSAPANPRQSGLQDFSRSAWSLNSPNKRLPTYSSAVGSNSTYCESNSNDFRAILFDTSKDPPLDYARQPCRFGD